MSSTTTVTQDLASHEVKPHFSNCNKDMVRVDFIARYRISTTDTMDLLAENMDYGKDSEWYLSTTVMILSYMRIAFADGSTASVAQPMIAIPVIMTSVRLFPQRQQFRCQPSISASIHAKACLLKQGQNLRCKVV